MTQYHSHKSKTWAQSSTDYKPNRTISQTATPLKFP